MKFKIMHTANSFLDCFVYLSDISTSLYLIPKFIVETCIKNYTIL